MASRIASVSGNVAHFNMSSAVEEDFDDESQSLAFDIEGLRPAAATAAQKAPQASQRRGALAAQAMSLSAFILALISVCLLSVVAFRLGGGSGASQPNVRDVIGLNEAGSKGGRGWYRTYLRTMVREGESMDSARVEILPSGSLVWVTETKGRRAHVLQPVKGWMSLRSAEGIEIMRPDLTYSGKMNKTQFEDVFKSAEMQNATKRLKAASAKLTALQAKMKQTMKQISNKEVYKKVGEKTQEVGSLVQKKTPQLEKLAGLELKKVINGKGAENLLKSLAKNPGMKEISSGAQANRMAMQDMQNLRSQLEGSMTSASAKAQDSANQLASAAVAAGDSGPHA